MIEAIVLIAAATALAAFLWVGLIKGLLLDHRVAKGRRERLKRPKPTLLH